MALATTCPQCKTSFKVVPDQLKLRRGLVRCGVCQHVFSGIDYLRYVDDATGLAHRTPPTAKSNTPPSLSASAPVEPPPPAHAHPAAQPEQQPSSQPEASTQGPHTVIDADNLKTAFFLSDSLIGPLMPDGSAPRPLAPSAPTPKQAPLSQPARPRHRTQRVSRRVPKPELAFDLLADLPPRTWHDRFTLRQSPYAWVATAVLVALLSLQALIGWRDSLAVQAPPLAPMLRTLFAPFGIRIAPPRDLTAMTIESFDLQTADTPNVLTLQAVLRNHARHAVGFPAMELTLTDTSGRLLVRKVIPVDVYLRRDPQAPNGLAAGAERPIKLALAHDGLQPAGFSVALFYP